MAGPEELAEMVAKEALEEQAVPAVRVVLEQIALVTKAALELVETVDPAARPVRVLRAQPVEEAERAGTAAALASIIQHTLVLPPFSHRSTVAPVEPVVHPELPARQEQ
jgi:hypothetical protein